MNDLNIINTAIASLNPIDLLRVILYGDKSFNKETMQDTNCIYQIYKRYTTF